VVFTYTPAGQRDTVTDARGVTDSTYSDAPGRSFLERVDFPDGTWIEQDHDQAGNRTATRTRGSSVRTGATGRAARQNGTPRAGNFRHGSSCIAKNGLRGSLSGVATRPGRRRGPARRRLPAGTDSPRETSSKPA
jgi:hypothetical protein